MRSFLAYLCTLCLTTYLLHPLPAPNSTFPFFSPSSTVAEAEETVTSPDLGITAPSYVLMEASTGQIICSQDADTRLSPASITKIMTLILIFDAIESGQIHLTDIATTSAYAKSMGGSQVFLEEGEQQTVETLIKCIVVASGNDASVTMAEYISGSETEFVNQMNNRAQSLGMENTHFEDCCGLTESDNHYTSARDVAIMSRELLTRYPQIKQYSGIWMENITHNTAQGTKEFGLSNTNKLLKQYQWTTGLKTGSTSKAKYCVSATAEKDGVELIAVIMACPNYKLRFAEAETLFHYGYSNCKLYKDETPESLPRLSISDGKLETIALKYDSVFSYLSTTGEDLSAITKEWNYMEDPSAPIEEGDVVGTLTYRLGDTVLGSVNILAAESVQKAGYWDYFQKLFGQSLL